MDYDPITIVKGASDYIDSAWEYTFPWIGDTVEMWNTTDSILVKTVKIKKYSPSNDPEMVKMQFSDVNDENTVDSLDLYPSQIVTGQYMLGHTCYCLKLVQKHP